MENRKSILHGDKYIWGIYICLCIISIIEIYSASSTLTYRLQDTLEPTIRHIQILLGGTALVLLVHNIPYRYFKLLPFALIPISILLLLYVMIFGESVNNAQRSAFGIQPSEIAKIGVVVGVAYVLSLKQRANGVAPETFKLLLAISVPPCLLIFPENFSTSLLLATVVFFMMLIGRVELRKIFGALAIVVAFIAVLLFVVPIANDYVTPAEKPGVEQSQNSVMKATSKVLGRLNTWIVRADRFLVDDGPDYLIKTDDSNYQEHHAKMAVANGGLIGVFPGNSRERDFLPQAYSDFIFAIILEETGFIGGVFVLILYLYLLIRTAIIAKKCTRAFPAFLVMGLSMLIVFQALINMGVSVGAFPVTGQPLPLISRGGNSAIACCLCFGMILSVSRFATVDEASKEDIVPDENIGEDIAAPNPNQKI